MVEQTMNSHTFNNELLVVAEEERDRVELREVRGNQGRNWSIWTDNHQASVPMFKECDIAEVDTAGKRSMGCFLLICNP